MKTHRFRNHSRNAYNQNTCFILEIIDINYNNALGMTAVTFSIHSYEPHFIFKADHPFQAFVIDKKHKTVLFSTRITKPVV